MPARTLACTCVRTYACTPTCIRTCTRPCICARTHARAHAYAHARTHARAHTHTPPRARTRARAHVHAQARTHARPYARTCTHLHHVHVVSSAGSVAHAVVRARELSEGHRRSARRSAPSANNRVLRVSRLPCLRPRQMAKAMALGSWPMANGYGHWLISNGHGYGYGEWGKAKG